MVSKFATLLVIHVIFLGVWMAKREKPERLSYWWKPMAYFVALYLVLGIIASLYKPLILPE